MNFIETKRFDDDKIYVERKIYLIETYMMRKRFIIPKL